jgi:hypothetical protein
MKTTKNTTNEAQLLNDALLLEEAIQAAKDGRTKDEVLETLTPQEFPLVAQRDGQTAAWEGNRVIAKMEEELLEIRKAE